VRKQIANNAYLFVLRSTRGKRNYIVHEPPDSNEGFAAQIVQEKSLAPRPGYKRDDKAMRGGVRRQL
jgi:hypothetical protein